VAAWPGGRLWVSQLQQPEECAFSFFHINRATTPQPSPRCSDENRAK
jgi:hypothetical protein